MSNVHSFAEFLSIVLKAVADRHPDQQQVLFAEDPQIIHRVFYEVERKYRTHFPQLNELHFITAGAYPYSPELTEALDRLQMSGTISRENPSYERFSTKRYRDTKEVRSIGQRSLLGSDATKRKRFEELVHYLDQELAASA